MPTRQGQKLPVLSGRYAITDVPSSRPRSLSLKDRSVSRHPPPGDGCRDVRLTLRKNNRTFSVSLFLKTLMTTPVSSQEPSGGAGPLHCVGNGKGSWINIIADNKVATDSRDVSWSGAMLARSLSAGDAQSNLLAICSAAHTSAYPRRWSGQASSILLDLGNDVLSGRWAAHDTSMPCPAGFLAVSNVVQPRALN